MNDRYFPAGALASGSTTVHVDPLRAGWSYCGLTVLQVPAGGTIVLDADDTERLVLSLSGSCSLTGAGEAFTLTGRADVFSAASDFAYFPRDTQISISSPQGGRFAVPFSRCERILPARYVPAAEVPVEIRGAGQATRQVNNFCAPEAFETDKLCAVEVLTPGGNWSSYPPHKHDQARDGEAVLEEIYYFEVAGEDAIGYQRAYSSGPDRRIDLLAEVRTGDVVLIPHGYHGPSMAAPGYDLYYLNVLAGPGEERTMAFCDDPTHAWIRTSWSGIPTDPRVPFFARDESAC